MFSRSTCRASSRWSDRSPLPGRAAEHVPGASRAPHRGDQPGGSRHLRATVSDCMRAGATTPARTSTTSSSRPCCRCSTARTSARSASPAATRATSTTGGPSSASRFPMSLALIVGRDRRHHQLRRASRGRGRPHPSSSRPRSAIPTGSSLEPTAGSGRSRATCSSPRMSSGRSSRRSRWAPRSPAGACWADR